MRGLEQKTSLELKLEKLRTICDKAPDHPIGLLALAETAFRRGLRLEALEAYQKVLKDESVAEAHLCMAQMYRHHALYSEATCELRTLFEIEPGYPEAHVFAKELAQETQLPEDIEQVLLVGCGQDELALARVRLGIGRSLVLREGQELVAIQDANSGDPTFGYYIGETRKRLTYCEDVLSKLSQLEEARKLYLSEQERLRQLAPSPGDFSAVPELAELPEALESLGNEVLDPSESGELQPETLESEIAHTWIGQVEEDASEFGVATENQTVEEPSFESEGPSSDNFQPEANQSEVTSSQGFEDLDAAQESESPIVEEVVQEDAPSQEDPSPGAELLEEELYAPLLASLENLIQTLAKTRSVSSVVLVNRRGYIVCEQLKDALGPGRLSVFVRETVEFLEHFNSQPNYWVLECAGGIVVIQSVDGYHYLVTIGQSGANFGALRYTMDRVRPNFEQVLLAARPG